MIALPKHETWVEYEAEVAVTMTLHFTMQHDVRLSYAPSHSDIDILLQNEARGDGLELTRNLFHFGKQHQLPVTDIALESVEKIDVQCITIRS